VRRRTFRLELPPDAGVSFARLALTSPLALGPQHN